MDGVSSVRAHLCLATIDEDEAAPPEQAIASYRAASALVERAIAQKTRQGRFVGHERAVAAYIEERLSCLAPARG